MANKGHAKDRTWYDLRERKSLVLSTSTFCQTPLDGAIKTPQTGTDVPERNKE